MKRVIKASSVDRLNALVDDLSEIYGVADLIWYIASNTSSVETVIEWLELLKEHDGADVDLVIMD